MSAELEARIAALEASLFLKEKYISHQALRIEALERALKRYQDGFHEWRRRGEKMEAALREIAASPKRRGPPDIQYWIYVANDRREIANAALTPEQENDDCK